MKGYKATNKEMRCRNFSYEIGKKLLENAYYALPMVSLLELEEMNK